MTIDNAHRPESSGLPSVSSDNSPAKDVDGRQLLAANLLGSVAASEFNVNVYLQLLFRHRKLIVTIIAAFVVLATVGTLAITPQYRATAVIQIERHDTRFTHQNGFETADEGGRGDAEFYKTQYDLLQSRSLAEQVAVRLGLLDDQRFLPTARGLLSGVRSLLFGGSTQELDALARRRAAVAKFTSNLIIEPKRGSRLVLIHYLDPDPSLAQLIVNGVADVFTSRNLERRFEASSYARSYLDERLQELKGKLEASEAELVAYGARQQIVNTGSGEHKGTLASVNLTTTNASLATARNERTRLEQLWAMAQTDNVYGLPQILDNKAMSSNREKRSTLAAEYQQKSTLFKSGYPEMMAIKSQMDELDRQATKIVNVVKDSIRTQYVAAKNQETELERQLVELKGELANEQARSIKYDMLQREVSTNRSLYEQMLQRAKEISVLGALDSNNISVVDPAEKPTAPYTPRPLFNLIVAAITGLLCSVAAVVVIEYLDNTVKTPQDVETTFRIPVLGLLPAVDDHSAIISALHDQRSNVSEALRSLKTALQFATPNGLPRSITVTSARPAEGKSTTSVALAKTCAEQGIRVLLIDADLRRPSLHLKIGQPNSVGLSNYLAGTTQASEVVQHTDTDNLFFIGSGPLPPNPADLFTGPKFPSLLALGGEFFDLIIVDAPPVLGLADAPLIANAISETIFVIAAGETRRDVIGVALKRLSMARAHVLGCVLNRFRFENAGYGYGGAYEHYYGYGYGDAGEEPSKASLEASKQTATVGAEG